MKKLLFLLLLPTTLLSQTYNELISIDSLDDFKRVVIENQYEFDEEEDSEAMIYKYRVESFALGNEEKWGAWYEDGTWVFLFYRRDTPLRPFGDYEDIVEEIKDNCSYVGIENHEENDYVIYKCEESNLDGKIGFMISEGVGFIRYFPNE